MGFRKFKIIKFKIQNYGAVAPFHLFNFSPFYLLLFSHPCYGYAHEFTILGDGAAGDVEAVGL